MQTMLEQLADYRDRQIVVNTYEDGVLVAKEDYRFDCIKVSDGKITVHNKNRTVKDGSTILLEIDTLHYPLFEKMECFPNHYAFSKEDGFFRIEIYFV